MTAEFFAIGCDVLCTPWEMESFEDQGTAELYTPMENVSVAAEH